MLLPAQVTEGIRPLPGKGSESDEWRRAAVRILIVDDEIQLLEQLEKILKNQR